VQNLVNQIRGQSAGTFFRPIVARLGNFVKILLRVIPCDIAIRKQIGGAGSFRFHSDFIFSDFRDWSSAHNCGFASLVEDCKGRRCVFDIGAHIGITALPMATMLSAGGIVHAFEASPTNVDMLDYHIRSNKPCNIRVIRKIVGDQTKMGVGFFQSSNVSGMNSLANRVDGQKWEKIRVDMVSLDDYCSDENCVPEVIKIDVEGAEARVLHGAETVLRKTYPIIYLSVHPRQLLDLGSSVALLREYIEDLGYQIEHPDGSVVAGEMEFSEYRLVGR
jgi:FkbM family methyltransferase